MFKMYYIKYSSLSLSLLHWWNTSIKLSLISEYEVQCRNLEGHLWKSMHPLRPTKHYYHYINGLWRIFLSINSVNVYKYQTIYMLVNVRLYLQYQWFPEKSRTFSILLQFQRQLPSSTILHSWGNFPIFGNSDRQIDLLKNNSLQNIYKFYHMVSDVTKTVNVFLFGKYA